MGQKKILKAFFENPAKEFGLRELARLSDIPKTTVSRLLKDNLKTKLVVLKDGKYSGNDENPSFKIRKKLLFLEEIYASGLIEFLQDKFYPKCMILFGSFAKGEYAEKSDIDIFLQAKEEPVELSRFERRLKHKISLFFEYDPKRLSDELFNNILNGIKLSGYIKLR